MSALLEIEDLHVSFATEDGVVKAVDGVSWSVEPGGALGIVGESGSGKSVSALTVLGLTSGEGTALSGSASFEGRDLLSLPADEMRAIRGNEIAMIFQDPLSSLHPLYTVGSQIVEAIRAHRKVPKSAAKARAVELLDMVGIADPAERVNSYPFELSGGMRQRAMIAMALANDPRLLIADEPTTALDVTVQAQILELIAKLRRELGMAVVLITHDLGVVATVTDEIAVMYAGRIVERAATAKIFDSPEHPYTWGLLQSIPRLDHPREERLLPIAGRPPSLIRRPGGCAFHPRCPYVRERHKSVDPQLEPVAGDADHEVACLLPSATRKRAWSELHAGRKPEAVVAAVAKQQEPG